MQDDANIIAAVDLGSNSFHMVVATLRHGQLTIIDRLKETVRLAEGLSSAGLALPAKERALQALARFGERLRAIQANNVRAVGTNALRQSGNDTEFQNLAEEALGHPIEIVSGIEEARLVYLGVAHSLPPTKGKRLVMDIGGGSTELIVGEGFAAEHKESLSMGAVMMSERFFRDGKFTSARFQEARMLARLKLRPIKRVFRQGDDHEAIGTSGTILAAHRISRALGLLDRGALTLEGLEVLIQKVLDAGDVGNLTLDGLSTKRSEVFAGGLAILVELLSNLKVRRLMISDGALREGVLYDLVGRYAEEDARVATVAAMVKRYHVDMEQAERIAVTAELLRQDVCADWQLGTDQARVLLCWAAYLHEIGFDIAHSDFHLHGAYIVANADMPGFPAIEQRMLSCLIGSQRKQLDNKALRLLPEMRQVMVLRLAVLVRLAILLHRSRSPRKLPAISLAACDNRLDLKFPDGWLDKTPLTLADLGREKRLLAASHFELNFS